MNSDNLNAELENGFSLYEQLEEKKLSIPKRSEFGKLPPLIEQFIQQFGDALFTRCEMDSDGMPYNPEVVNFFHTHFPVETGPKTNRRICAWLGELRFREWLKDRILAYGTEGDNSYLDHWSTDGLVIYLYELADPSNNYNPNVNKGGPNKILLEAYAIAKGLTIITDADVKFTLNEPSTLEHDPSLLLDSCEQLTFNWWSYFYPATPLPTERARDFVVMALYSEVILLEQKWNQLIEGVQSKHSKFKMALVEIAPITTDCQDNELVSLINKYAKLKYNVDNFDNLPFRYNYPIVPAELIEGIGSIIILSSASAFAGLVMTAFGIAGAGMAVFTVASIGAIAFTGIQLGMQINNALAYFERDNPDAANSAMEQAKGTFLMNIFLAGFGALGIQKLKPSLSTILKRAIDQNNLSITGFTSGLSAFFDLASRAFADPNYLIGQAEYFIRESILAEERGDMYAKTSHLRNAARNLEEAIKTLGEETNENKGILRRTIDLLEQVRKMLEIDAT